MKNIHPIEFKIFQNKYPNYKKSEDADNTVDESEVDSSTDNSVISTPLQLSESNDHSTKSTKRLIPFSDSLGAPEKRVKQITINTMFESSTSLQQNFIDSVSMCFADASIPYLQVESPLFWDMLEKHHK